MLLLAILAPLALAEEPGCAWKGQLVDPLTLGDGRYIELPLRLGVPGSKAARLVVHHATDGVMRMNLRFAEEGAGARRLDGTLEFGLADGTEVSVWMLEDGAPTPLGGTGPYGLGTSAMHSAEGTLSRPDAERLAAATRLTQLVHTLSDSGTITRTLSAGESKRLLAAFTCAVQP